LILNNQTTNNNHPLDGVTNPQDKLLRFSTITFFLQKEESTSFKPGYVLPSRAMFMVDSLPFNTKLLKKLFVSLAKLNYQLYLICGPTTISHYSGF
jgi:hypothetical protein